MRKYVASQEISTSVSMRASRPGWSTAQFCLTQVPARRGVRSVRSLRRCRNRATGRRQSADRSAARWRRRNPSIPRRQPEGRIPVVRESRGPTHPSSVSEAISVKRGGDGLWHVVRPLRCSSIWQVFEKRCGLWRAGSEARYRSTNCLWSLEYLATTSPMCSRGRPASRGALHAWPAIDRGSARACERWP
jgi:hypothetical protein